jgi:hypothetical protein
LVARKAALSAARLAAWWVARWAVVTVDRSVGRMAVWRAAKMAEAKAAQWAEQWVGYSAVN